METDTICPVPLSPTPAWTVAGLLLDALTRRDFAALERCLAPDVRFRALVPPGLVTFDEASLTAAKFETWFGGADEFEVVDATVGQIGARLALRWRVRMWPCGDPGAARVVEQHVYATGTGSIESMDLLCSGFHAETDGGAA